MNVHIDRIINQTGQYFCYLYTRSTKLAIFGGVEITFSFLMLLYTLFHFTRTVRLEMLSKNLKFIYAAIFAMCLIFLSKMIISEVIYWLNHNKEESDEFFQLLSLYSKYILMIDIIESFTVQGLLIRVCYNWMQKIVELLQKLSQFEEEKQTQATLKIIRFDKLCKKVLAVYLLSRFILYLVVLILLFFQSNPSGPLYYVAFLFLMIESLFTPIIIGLGIYAIKRNKKLTQIVDEAEIKTIINQYSILFLCTLARFGFNIWKAVQQVNHVMSTQCQMDSQRMEDVFLLALSIYFVQDVLFFLPAMIVLRIFYVKNTNQMSNSLLESDRLQQEQQPVDTAQILHS